MFSCCCADTASRGEIQIEENHEGVDGTQEHKGGDAAAAPAAPAAAAAAAESTEATPAAAAAPAPAAADAAANEHSVAAAVGRIKITPAKKDEAPAKKPMTAPKSDRARRTSVPLESPLEDGMFLMYDNETDTIYIQWSQTPQLNALAWLKPLVAIPGHKYKVNKGKQTLFTKAVEEGKYYKGWIKFICLVNEYPSKLMLLDNFIACKAPDIQLLQLVPAAAASTAAGQQAAAAAAAAAAGGECSIVECIDNYNKLYDLKNVFAVAAVPINSTLIPLYKEVNIKKFLQMGQGEGDAAAIQIKKA